MLKIYKENPSRNDLRIFISYFTNIAIILRSFAVFLLQLKYVQIAHSNGYSFDVLAIVIFEKSTAERNHNKYPLLYIVDKYNFN